MAVYSIIKPMVDYVAKNKPFLSLLFFLFCHFYNIGSPEAFYSVPWFCLYTIWKSRIICWYHWCCHIKYNLWWKILCKEKLLNSPLQVEQTIDWLSHTLSWLWMENSSRKTGREVYVFTNSMSIKGVSPRKSHCPPNAITLSPF